MITLHFPANVDDRAGRGVHREGARECIHEASGRREGDRRATLRVLLRESPVAFASFERAL